MAVGIALALLLALIVVLLVQSDFGAGDNAAPTLDVPGVVGVPYGQADAALTKLGFTVQRTDEDAPYQAPDAVLGQDPEQGRKIPKGGLITLTVSSATITMPDVVGQTREAAASNLAKVNLGVHIGGNAAVLFRKTYAEQADRGGLAVELARKFPGLLPGFHLGHDLLAHETGERIAELTVRLGVIATIGQAQGALLAARFMRPRPAPWASAPAGTR